MSAKLRNIASWKQLPGGSVLPLPGKERARTVPLEFNVDRPTTLTVLQNGRGTLLRAISPSECPLMVSFSVAGDCAIVADTDGEVWWRTDDGLILSYDVVSESFTKLEQRMEMTPEMELTIYKANLRSEQRKSEVLAIQLAKKQREEAAAAGADPETGEVDDEEEIVVDADAGAAVEGAPAGDSAAPKPKP